MCGRFTKIYTWEELVRLYRLTDPYMISNLQPRYNICPTTEIDVVVIGAFSLVYSGYCFNRLGYAAHAVEV